MPRGIFLIKHRNHLYFSHAALGMPEDPVCTRRIEGDNVALEGYYMGGWHSMAMQKVGYKGRKCNESKMIHAINIAIDSKPVPIEKKNTPEHFCFIHSVE